MKLHPELFCFGFVEEVLEIELFKIPQGMKEKKLFYGC